jgi:hypothetical protein
MKATQQPHDAPRSTFGTVPTSGKPQATVQPKAVQATTGVPVSTVPATPRQSRQG